MRLNLDAGELPDESPALWAQFDILNIACGGHAGDTESMTRLVRFCVDHDIAIGAHPSYPDREHFGRRTLAIDRVALFASLTAQCTELATIARGHGGKVRYVKPHGALYHDASRDPALAAIVADAVVLALGSHVTIIGPRGHLQTAATSRSLGFAVEGFADRRMRPDGSLVPRSEPDALITSPALAVAQALSLTNVDTICVHADTPGSLEIAHAVRAAIEAHDTRITAGIKSDADTGTTASTTARIKSDGSSTDAGASTTARIKSDGSSTDAGASTTARIKSDGSSTDAGASTIARIKSDASSTDAGASTIARIKSDASSTDAGASDIESDESSADARASDIESDGSSTDVRTSDIESDGSSSISTPTWVALGDRAIRFARPRSTSARALVAAIKRWPGVVDVVVARHDVAAYFDAPFTRAPFASTNIDVDHRTRAPFVSTNLDVDHRTPFVSTNLDVDRRTPLVSTNLDVDYRIAELADVRDLDVPVREHELRAIYDGIDLEDVARATGLTVDEVVSAHVGTTYDVDTLGFAPGFAYLVGLDPRLHVPRRATPRTRVPAGALAIAGEYTAVYPFVSPGGWNLIGRVDEKMFDAKSGAHLQLGDRVRFVR